MKKAFKSTVCSATSTILVLFSSSSFAKSTHWEPKFESKCKGHVAERIATTALLPLTFATEITVRALFLFVDPLSALTDFSTGPLADSLGCVIGRNVHIEVLNDPKILKKISEDLNRPLPYLTAEQARSNYNISESDRIEYNASLDKLNRIQTEIMAAYQPGEDSKPTLHKLWEAKFQEEEVPVGAQKTLYKLVYSRVYNILATYAKNYNL